MPAGKGKTVLRCYIRSELHAALTEEATRQDMDLSHVVEGHLEHSRLLTRSEHQLIERRLDALSRGQEQIVGLLESLVTRLEQGPMTPEASHDGDTPPVATYDQMYGRISDPAATSNDPAVTPESTPVKRSWRPW